MCGLDVVRMIVPPASAHSLRTFMVGDDVGIVAEVLVANRADARLFSDLAVHQFPHFRRRSQFPISSRVVGILNSLNSKSDELWFGQKFASTTRERFVDRTQFIGTKSHGIPFLKREKWSCVGGTRLGTDSGGGGPATIPARRRINDESGYCGPAVEERT
jgi:hypothetical protein